LRKNKSNFIVESQYLEVEMVKTVIIDGARTPIGKFGGALSSLTAAELGGIAMKEAMKRANVEPEELDEVIFGNVLQAGQG
jgi:acetyl-CoA C-acetyltransferase